MSELDDDFRIAALFVQVEIIRAQRGVPGAAACARAWLEMLAEGDYSFVPSGEAEPEEVSHG